MSLFTRNRDAELQGFVVRLLNNNCPELRARLDGPRLEGRVNLTIVVRIVPIEDGDLLVAKAYSAVTKEFSTTGVALVLDEPRAPEEVALGFRWGGKLTWLRAKAKHLNPMGGGFYQLGLRLTDMLHLGDHPELAKAGF